MLDDEEEQKSLTDFLLEKYKCFPVFLAENLLNEFNCFCNSILCPIFNNIVHIDAAEVPQYSLEKWEVYKSVNSIFSEAIMSNYSNELI